MECKVTCHGETIFVQTSNLVVAVNFAITVFEKMGINVSNASSIGVTRINDNGERA